MTGDAGAILGLLFEHSPVPQFVSRADGAIILANPASVTLLGTTPEEILGMHPADVTHPDDLPRLLRLGAKLVGGEIEVLELELRVLVHDRTTWCQATCTMAEGPDGEPLIISQLVDISALLAAREEVERLANIADTTSDLVGIVDAEGWVVYANQAARRAHGPHRFEGGPVHGRDLYTPASLETFFTRIQAVLLQGRHWSGVMEMYGPDDEVVPIWQTMAPHFGPDGALVHISAVGRDVSEQRRLEAELTHRATHDVLTGLPNRAHLLEALGRAVGTDLEASGPVAVLFVDLDRFKAVNDELGHEAGDELLRAVSSRLASVLRPVDVVARLGGDEFVVVCPDLRGRDDAEEVATRLLRAVASTPIRVGDRDIAITASVGISVSSGEPDDHPESLLRDADRAMYQAKARGRARFELFDPTSIAIGTDRG